MIMNELIIKVCWNNSHKKSINIYILIPFVGVVKGEDWKSMELSKEFVEKLSTIFFGSEIDEDLINLKELKRH